METVVDLTPTSKKCFLWPIRSRKISRKQASKVRISWPRSDSPEERPAESPAKTPDPKVVICFSKSTDTVHTFARCDCGTKSFPQRMTMCPFFGIYSGSLVTFDIRRSRSPNDSMVSIRVTIQDGEDTRKALTTLYIPRHRKGSPAGTSQDTSIKDRCLAFAHDVNTTSDIADIASSCRQPPSLFFLCQQHILLHLGEINADCLPKTETFEALKLQSTRNIFVRVYLPSQAEDLMLRMRVKSSLSMHELKWMIAGRLPFAVHPSCLALYQFDSLDVLPADSVLQPKQSLLHCTINAPPPVSRPHRSPRRKPSRYMVSLIGKEVDAVVADPTTTLYKFQELVKLKFGLKSSSYIYFPNLGKASGKSSDCGIKMSTIIDKSTITLIDSMRRNLPIVDGIPSGISKYEKLSAYTKTIGSLGISPSVPTIAFEVTGPTIPISFRAAVQDRGNCNYSLVSDRVHAVSVNPTWTIRTLLKYVECISKIPCVDMSLNSEILPIECNVSSHLTRRCWLVRHTSKHIELVKDLPTIIYS